MLQLNITMAESEPIRQKTCIYRGVTYFVATDMYGKCFIEVHGKRMYLDCNGNVAKKQRGSKSVKTAIESFEDMKKVQDYFLEKENWNFYLLFTLNINTGRRISDLLETKWSDFFFKNGNMKTYWDVQKLDKDGQRVRGEKKTSKAKEIYINVAIQEAFKVFLEHEKINFEYDYEEHVFKQLHGTHRGKVLTAEGYRKALMKAEECLGYNIRSHSMRRGMGKMMMELHPNDNKAKSVLMELYNHSSEKMTNNYLGETAKMEREYLEDFGEKYKKYVIEGEQVPFLLKKPVSTYDTSELREYMICAFAKILDLKDETDPIALMRLYNELLDGLESIAR